MAHSKIRTLLSIDEWAAIVGIPGWIFNQVRHDERPLRGNCEDYWLQSSHYSDPNHPIGRDEVARAIATAEQRMADSAGFFMAPKWVCAEKIKWPQPKRGYQVSYPILQTRWGYLISGGIEAYDQITLYPTPIVYSDEDGDGVLDTGTITYNLYLEEYDDCEIVVVPPGEDPYSEDWRIRPLEIEIDATTNVLTITGPRWMFVNPDEWNQLEPLLLSDDTAFLETVDLYRHYNKTYPTQAEYVWLGDACSTSCSETCQDACMTVLNERLGHFEAKTATWGSGAWVTTNWTVQNYTPSRVNAWYYSGYRDYSCEDCDFMPEQLKQAIVSLANVYLRTPPCACGIAAERLSKDREEQEMDNINVALAKTAFGTAAAGAVFAYSIVSGLPQIGRGG